MDASALSRVQQSLDRTNKPRRVAAGNEPLAKR